ncbi:MAG TPA: aminotransferase class IV [Vicinamibacteria bacterium]|nr:aminotransferase class IV [Vicinamibacteria bacterium]
MRTFEATREGLVAISEDQSAREASAGLPQGAYTTLRTHHGSRVLRPSDHVRRLVESARLLGQSGELSETVLRRAIASALDATGYDESRVRLTWAPPRLFVSVEPFTPYAESLYREGVACVTVPLHRDNPRSKDTRFIQAAGAAYDRLPDGVQEGLMVDADGTILEGLSSNFFAVRDGALATEEERVLAGLTRSLVLEVAADLLPRAASPLRRADLPLASECFITSASRGVLPVVRVDDVTIGAGRPGPLTRAIRERYERRVEAEAEDVGA